MKRLFFMTCYANNNEEYKKVLKKRMIGFAILGLTGIATMGFALLGEYFEWIKEADYQFGFLAGLGFGLFLASILVIVKICRKLKNEEKLKESRLSETDEREIEVSNRAMRMSGMIILLALYVILVAGGLLLHKEIMAVCYILIGIFLISYVAFRKYYEKIL